jgi:1-aminocyclopropane-1-carboxylate deaminase/D-cysteine desulfhydrase-like pyridoxal-dependent ACC family enzyme
MRGLARIALGCWPTPLDEAPRLAAELGLRRLLIKREDLSAVGFGGNKARQIEVILAEARRAGADTIVTTAGLQSNFCRSMAGAAARLGLRCVLLLRGNAEMLRAPQGNLLLDLVFGAEIELIDTRDPYHPAIADRLAAIAARQQAAGRRPHIVHLTGRTGALAAAAYVRGARELDRDLTRRDASIGRIYVAVGSGLTAAGLALGLKALRRKTRVVGISVQQRADFIAPLIVERANQAASLLKLSTRLRPRDIDIDDSEIGGGYGVPSPASIAAVRLAGRCEGLVLDPGYTGKCFAALIAHARRLGPRANVGFLHSGGAPGLFAAAAALAPSRSGR